MSGANLPDELIETMDGLVALMEEESELLPLSGPTSNLGAIADAKLRLTARLEQINARLDRERPGWMAALDGPERSRFSESADALHEAATVNSDILQRQIDLSADMIEVEGRELERLTGRNGSTYSRGGHVRKIRATLPLSVNRRY